MANDQTISDPGKLYHQFPEGQMKHIQDLARRGMDKDALRKRFGLSKGQLKRILRKRWKSKE